MGNSIALIDDKDPSIVQANLDANSYLAAVEAYVIDSPEMYELANAELSAMRAREVAIEEKRTAITKPINEGLRLINSFFGAPRDLIIKAKNILADKMSAYQRAEKIKLQEAEKLAMAQQQAARIEAATLVAKAEEDLRAGKITDAAFVEANTQAAIMESAMPMVAVNAPLAKGGNAQREDYLPEVVNLPQLLRYLADSLERGEKQFDNTVTIKETQLKAYGKMTQGSVAIPGITWKQSTKIIARKS